MQINPDLLAYLQRKQWLYRPCSDGRNLAVKQCPFCGRAKWKFQVLAETTQYRCFHCNASGNLYKLKRELGDVGGGARGVVSAAKASGEVAAKPGKPIPLSVIESFHARLLRSKVGMAYCEQRGFDLATVKHFKLGLQIKHGVRWLVIPHLGGGVCHNVKFRSLPPEPKSFRRQKGAASVLFNADALAEHDSVVVAEAETDAMALWAAGVRNVVSLTCGAGTFLPEWYDAFADKSRVVLCLDADAVGQTGAREIARRLGFDRCENVLLPLHDANEVLTQMGAEELERAVQRTERFEVEGVLTLRNAITQCATHTELGGHGLMSPWRGVNRIMRKGWNPGDLVVLSAKVKTGKTTFALAIAKHLAETGTPSLVYCLEMDPRRLAEKLVASQRRVPADDLTPIDFKLARFWLRRLPLYFIEPAWGADSLKPERVFDKVRETVKRHGVKFMVFDHLHFLCRSLQHLNNEIGQVTRGFKLLAEELGIVVMLVAQPKKVTSGKVITYDDIKDSASIPADADQVILLHRKPVPAATDDLDSSDDQEVLEPKTLVRFDAARFQAGGETWLHYAGDTATFIDWDDRPQVEAPKL